MKIIKKGCYIGVTKRKIKERIKEHQNDIRNSKNNTAIAKLALNQNIQINFNNLKKLANYNNRTYGYCREAIEIENSREACNDTEHFSLDPEWQQILNERSMPGGGRKK